MKKLVVCIAEGNVASASMTRALSLSRCYDCIKPSTVHCYSIVQTLPATARSGSRFREGVHTVMYVATDNAGLTSTCTFQFEVQGTSNGCLLLLMGN